MLNFQKTLSYGDRLHEQRAKQGILQCLLVSQIWHVKVWKMVSNDASRLFDEYSHLSDADSNYVLWTHTNAHK